MHPTNRWTLCFNLVAALVVAAPFVANPETQVAESSQRQAISTDGSFKLAQGKCIKYVVKKKCVRTKTEIEDLKTAPGPDPEKAVEFTMREKCVKWEDEKFCVQWEGSGPEMLPDQGR